MVVAKYELFCAPDEIPETAENAGLYAGGVQRVLHQIREAGAAYEVVDVSDYTPDELQHAYERAAVTPAVRRGYGVKRVFGTNKYSGARFGKEVPALVLLDESGRVVDVYPHEEDGRIVTIAEYVAGLGGEMANEGKAALVARMDALRAKIGAIGVNTNELVDEGRRR